MDKNYRTEIDGLRAVAVISVVIYHLNKEFLSFGFLGVDIFFVISGYLITGIIVKKLEIGAFSLSDFFGRRVKRIIPATIVVTLCTILAVAFFSMESDRSEFSRDGFFALTSLSNFNSLFNYGSYWGSDAERSPFLHFWSLSVEEQFYMVYPLMLVFAYKKKANLEVVLSLAFIGSFLLYGLLHVYKPSYSFYLFPARAWQLIAGGLMVYWMPRFAKLNIAKKPICNVLLVVILLTLVIPFEKWSSVRGVLVTGSTALFIGLSGIRSLSYSLLNTGLMRFVGKISYSLYLWHWPVIVILNNFVNEKDLTYYVGISIVMVGLSLLSYYYVEKSFRSNATKPAAILVALLAFTIPVVLLSAKSTLFVNEQLNPIHAKYFGPLYDIGAVDGPLLELGQVDVSKKPNENYQKAVSTGFLSMGDESSGSSILLIGDSHSLMWADTLKLVAKRAKAQIDFMCVADHAPFFTFPPIETHYETDVSRFSKGDYFLFDQGKYRRITTAKYDLIVLVCRWDMYAYQASNELRAFINNLSQKAGKVLLVSQPPILDYGNCSIPEMLTLNQRFFPNRNELRMLDSKRWESGVEFVKSYEADDSVLTFHPSIKHDSGKVVVNNKEVSYYIDDDHLSNQGAMVDFDALHQLISHHLNN